MRPLSLLALLIALAPSPALADSTAAAGKPAKAKFDPATVVTVTGKVLGEQRVDNGKGKKAVRLVIKVGDEQVSVQLGPDSFVDGQKTRFAAGDEVTVTTVAGSNLALAGFPAAAVESARTGAGASAISRARRERGRIWSPPGYGWGRMPTDLGRNDPARNPPGAFQPRLKSSDRSPCFLRSRCRLSRSTPARAAARVTDWAMWPYLFE